MAFSNQLTWKNAATTQNIMGGKNIMFEWNISDHWDLQPKTVWHQGQKAGVYNENTALNKSKYFWQAARGPQEVIIYVWFLDPNYSCLVGRLMHILTAQLFTTAENIRMDFRGGETKENFIILCYSSERQVKKAVLLTESIFVFTFPNSCTEN